jgi:hypothetical protein
MQDRINSFLINHTEKDYGNDEVHRRHSRVSTRSVRPAPQLCINTLARRMTAANGFDTRSLQVR